MPRDLADELLQAKVKTRLFGGDRAPRLGRLVILDRIGSGAMGAVYAAYDPRLDRRVAVKVLHAADAEANARSLREARALGKLSHPNVIAIHDAGEENGAVHIVMELATGTPLRAWMAKPRTAREVVRVMRDVARGLAAAHRAGIVHRDVKPDNIIVGDDTTRLIDFGLAAADGDRDGAGTPSYLAPEVLAGRPATAASDQFSFGVTLYEALHGDRPHAGATRDELHASANTAAAARMTAPSWLAAIVKRTLAADPTQRFPTMDDVVVALGRDRRRTRVIAAVSAGALVIGAVGGALIVRTDDSLCDGNGRVMWDRARVASALGAAPWVEPAVSSLAAIERDWRTTYHRVCSATRVDGAQSDRLLELRMRCLDRALERFTALTAALAGPLDERARIAAPAAIAELPSPSACAALVDDAELALPAKPADRERVRAAEQALDRAWTAYALARYDDARTRAHAVDSATAELDAPALRAQIAVLAASVEARIGAPDVARARLHAALALTARARAHALEHAVWMRLLRHELFAGNPARVVEWERFARAAALRAGLDGAELDGIVGEAHRDSGDLVRAREALARALASRDPLRPDQLAIVEMNAGAVELALGQSFLARSAFERALAHATRQLGDGHPSLALYRDKLAAADRARGRITAALAHHDASIALRTAAYGARDRSVATARFHRGQTLLAAGDFERARADLEAARALRAQHYGAHSPRLAELDVALGDLELARGNRPHARELYTRAATLDPRLDLAARTAPDDAEVSVTPLTLDRAPILADRLRRLPPATARAYARQIYDAWRAARTDDPTLTIAAADAMTLVDTRIAAELYGKALSALAPEPSRLRAHAERALATLR